MRPSIRQVMGASGLCLAALALALIASPAAAQDAYTLPQQPTAQSGGTFYYAVPIGYTWDHFSYFTNVGDWNIAIGDSGFDAGEIPNNPLYCGPNGDDCPPDAGPKGPTFITTNNDPLHGYAGIPLFIGPTQDGYNNAQIGRGQVIPIVPGSYSALFIAYAAVNGPHERPVVLNYTDGVQIINAKWADWCAASQAPPDFFSWAARHRHGQTGPDNNSCSLITKYIPVNPNRTLVSITLEHDQREASTAVEGVTNNGGGQEVPGDTVTSGNGRTVIGAITLASTDNSLGSYGLVRGQLKNADGSVFTTPPHDHVPDIGADVFVMDPPLGNYGTGVNIDGTYFLGLPAGTYTLSAALRGGTDQPESLGPQATPVTVTVTAGQVTTQDITLLEEANLDLWAELTGTVQDASGAPVSGAAVLVAKTAEGPFSAVGQPGQGITQADGTYRIPGLAAGEIFVKAATNGAASESPVRVTLTGGQSVTQDLTVAPLPIGSIAGTVKTPEGDFGGIGVPVTLRSKDGATTLRTTTYAFPLLVGTSVVPQSGVTSTFNFDGVAAGEYDLILPVSAFQGEEKSTPVTVTQGQTTNVELTTTYPPWTEGTPDAALSDPLTGTTLDAKWKVVDVGEPVEPGTAQLSGDDGLEVTASGAGWDVNNADDGFTYVYQSGIPQTDWVAYVTVHEVPDESSGAVNVQTPNGEAGLMLRSPTTLAGDTALDPRAANFSTAVTNGMGINTQGRVADGLQTFLFQETAPGTNPEFVDNPGTQPPLPVTLKIRKVGPTIAAFYSADNGQTQRFIGAFLPQFDPSATLLLGMATTSNTDIADTAQYTNFVFAPLAAAPPPPPPSGVKGDVDGNGQLAILDVVAALRIVAGLATATPENLTGGDLNANGRIEITEVVQILRAVAGLAPL